MKVESLAAMIPADAEPIVLEILDRIGKMRALHDDESKLTAALVRREKRRLPNRNHSWTRQEDRELLRAQYRPRGVIVLAEDIGVTEKAARRRLEKLRDQGRCGKLLEPVEV